jgi:DNA-binding MarR family transcriptional regulator
MPSKFVNIPALLTGRSDSCTMQQLSNRTNSSHAAFEAQLVALIRALGLHRPDQTPCGAPISVGEAHALFEISRRPGISQNDLAAHLRLEKSTVSRLAKILEQRGWLDRTRDVTDARLLHLRVSGAGAKMARQLAASRQAKFSKVFEAIPAHKRQTVLDSLLLLSEVLDET